MNAGWVHKILGPINDSLHNCVRFVTYVLTITASKKRYQCQCHELEFGIGMGEFLDACGS